MQKILICVNVRHKTDDKIPELLGKIYETYAHIVPSIYHFRSYISENYKKSEERTMIRLSTAEAFFTNSKVLKEVLTSLDTKSWLLPLSQLKDEKQRDIIQENMNLAQLLTNALEIKNSSQELSDRIFTGLVSVIKELNFVINTIQKKIIR